MPDKILTLAGDRTQLIDRIIQELGKQVESSQAGLLKLVVEDFLDQLDQENGVITNSLKNKRLLGLLDQVFTEYNKTYGLEVVKQIFDGVQQIIDFNSAYFEVIAKPAQLAPIKKEVITLVQAWLGVDDNGKATPNGYLDTLVKDPSIKNQVRNIAMGAVIGESGYFETKKAVATFVTGQGENAGALSSYTRNFVYDMYSQLDRANGLVYADKLGLEYAIYEGGLIKTSRPFCRERNGKVFTREEIMAFDPPKAKPPGYNPLTDLGGYGCRHHLNWITKILAFALRPDLKTAA
jgi:hypothetical protein